MANLTEHVMLNKWDDDINNAITSVGGNTYGSEGLPDYADIIKTQLVSNEAVGNNIYQDFLYTYNNQGYIYPWEGDPTKSTNAVQAKPVAEAIKVLYDTMANTERFTVLLVDEFPKTEINLSAIYLVRSQCECEECPEDCNCKENTYTGCYYIKQGKSLKRIDIPEFKFELDELFYLTRAEYDASLSDYVKEIEDMLRKKFGKYWDDDGFTLDGAVEEIQKELQQKTDEIIQNALKTMEEALSGVDEKIASVETSLNAKFEELENSIQEDIQNIQQQVTDKSAELDEKFNNFQTDSNAKFEELENSIQEDIQNIQQQVTDNKVETESKLEEMYEFIQSELEERVKYEDMLALDASIIEELK